jgi:dockerin type I repeat protein/thrombospondin type 3 repeat protein
MWSNRSSVFCALPVKLAVASLLLLSESFLSPLGAAAPAVPLGASEATVVLVDVADNTDSDADGLTDALEATLGTDPFLADSDGDGPSDFWEVKHSFDPLNAVDLLYDSDSDGLTDLLEWQLGTSVYETDSDGDGYWDGIEWDLDTDPALGWSAPFTGVYCDVTMDGSVNSSDVQFVINGALGIETPIRVDVNGYGDTNAVDVQEVINAALSAT